MTRIIKPILVLGLGNLLQSDDGVGCHIIRALESQALNGNIELIDSGTSGIGLVNLFEGRRRVIVVDAAQMSEPPGTVRRITLGDLYRAGSVTPYSLHYVGVTEAMQLAYGLNLPLPEITIIGIQPMRIDWGETLSVPVQNAIPQIVSEILQILDSMCTELAPPGENQEQTNSGE